MKKTKNKEKLKVIAWDPLNEQSIIHLVWNKNNEFI